MKVYTTNKNVAAHYSDEEKYQRLVDGTPRAGLPAFLAEFHDRQKIRAEVSVRKAAHRKKYQRSYRNRGLKRPCVELPLSPSVEAKIDRECFQADGEGVK